MSRYKMMVSVICVSIMILTLSSGVQASVQNKKTTVKFAEMIEIPGVGQQFLPAGTYVFKLLDSQSNRHIVQIFNAEETQVLATILAIPNYRLRSTDKTVMTFSERAVDKPEAIRAWFYPGANWGEEFVYPKTRAVELAKLANEPVLAMPAELAQEILRPVESATTEPVRAWLEAPVMAVIPTGEEVELAEVVEYPPVEAEVAVAPETVRLPQTASSLPLLVLIGLLSLGAGAALSFLPKRKT